MATNAESSTEKTLNLKLRNIYCDVCGNVYRLPRILPCLHSFCTDCILNLPTRSKSDDVILNDEDENGDQVQGVSPLPFSSNYETNEISRPFRSVVARPRVPDFRTMPSRSARSRMRNAASEEHLISVPLPTRAGSGSRVPNKNSILADKGIHRSSSCKEEEFFPGSRRNHHSGMSRMPGSNSRANDRNSTIHRASSLRDETSFRGKKSLSYTSVVSFNAPERGNMYRSMKKKTRIIVCPKCSRETEVSTDLHELPRNFILERLVKREKHHDSGQARSDFPFTKGASPNYPEEPDEVFKSGDEEDAHSNSPKRSEDPEYDNSPNVSRYKHADQDIYESENPHPQDKSAHQPAKRTEQHYAVKLMEFDLTGDSAFPPSENLKENPQEDLSTDQPDSDPQRKEYILNNEKETEASQESEVKLKTPRRIVKKLKLPTLYKFGKIFGCGSSFNNRRSSNIKEKPVDPKRDKDKAYPETAQSTEIDEKGNAGKENINSTGSSKLNVCMGNSSNLNGQIKNSKISISGNNENLSSKSNIHRDAKSRSRPTDNNINFSLSNSSSASNSKSISNNSSIATNSSGSSSPSSKISSKRTIYKIDKRIEKQEANVDGYQSDYYDDADSEAKAMENMSTERYSPETVDSASTDRYCISCTASTIDVDSLATEEVLGEHRDDFDLYQRDRGSGMVRSHSDYFHSLPRKKSSRRAWYNSENRLHEPYLSQDCEAPYTTSGFEPAAQTWTQVTCESHPGQELSQFCLWCEECVCRLCALTLHSSHDCRPVSAQLFREQMNAVDKLIRSAVPKVKDIEHRLHDLEQQRAKVKGRIQEVAGEVNDFIDMYVEAVEQHRLKLLSQLAKLEQSKEGALNTAIERVGRVHTDVQETCRFVAELLRGASSDAEIISVKRLISQRLSVLLDTTVDDPKELDGFLKFCPADKGDTINDFQLFGRVVDHLASAATSYISGDGLGSVRIGRSSTVRLTVCGEDGVPCCGSDVTVKAWLCSIKDQFSKPPPVTLKRIDEGYSINFTPISKGLHLLHVALNGEAIKGSPFKFNVKSRWRQHQGAWHCCTVCSTGGRSDVPCGCGGIMGDGYLGCCHDYPGHPGTHHWSCCGKMAMDSECGSVLQSPVSGVRTPCSVQQYSL